MMDKPIYIDTLRSIERLHRRLLDLIKAEFDSMGWNDITPIQALMMFNMGTAELSATELRTRGLYLGSNATYNLKRLVEGEYIVHERDQSDRRSVRIKLTPKGLEVAEVVDDLYARHLKAIDTVPGLDEVALSSLRASLAQLERLWAVQSVARF